MRHYRWISWSDVGLLAAAATELVVRVIPFANNHQVWLATAAATAIITISGKLLITRHEPRAA